MKETRKCLICGKEFECWPSESKKYCSRKCNGISRTTSIQYKDFTCEWCGKHFKRRLKDVHSAENKGQKIRFCSFKCKEEHWGRNRVKQTCPVCGKIFLLQKKDATPGRACSSECAAKNIKNRRLHLTPMTTIICAHCGKEFKEHDSYIRTQNARGQKVRFCSRKCSLEHTGRAPIERVTVECELCHKPFVKKINENKRFCSEKCRKSNLQRGTTYKNCPICGKQFKVIASNPNKKYCSRECWDKDRSIKKDNYAKLQHYLRSSSEYVQWRYAVLFRAHFQCEECGSKKALHVHHKTELYKIAQKYDFKIEDILASEEFNDPDNGQCLCIQCHIKAHPFNRKLRDKLGRFSRLEFKVQEETQDNNPGIKLERE